MGQIYEGMVLLDNDVVRNDWRKAKAIVTETLGKYEAIIHTARRWDERALAYPIKRNQRATYFLTYFELPKGQSNELRRSFDLNEHVLRYLFLAVDEVPAEEADLASAEESTDFAVEAPPEDGPRPTAFDEIDAQRESEQARAAESEAARRSESEAKDGQEAKKEASTEEAKTEEATAESTPDAGTKEEAPKVDSSSEETTPAAAAETTKES